jgi:tetratricopeptide (TPR) repeat protein
LSESGQLQLGDAYLQTGDRDSARLIWENLANQVKPIPEALERLVRFDLENGDISGATASLQALTTLQPDNAHNYYQLGLLIATRDPEASLVYLARAAELDEDFTSRTRTLQRGISTSRLDDDPAYRLMGAGRALASLEEWPYAAEAFRQATILRPDYAEAWAYLGEALQHLPSENPSQAVGLAELQKAVELEPTSLSANTFLALFWQRQGRYDLALEAIQAAVELAPSNPVLQVELGNTLALQGDLETAYQAYLQAIEFAPHDPSYYNVLVRFCLTHDYHVSEIALPASRQALLLAPEDPSNLDWMGQTLLHLGDLVNAERFFKRAIENDPQFAASHLHLGMLYILRNQTEHAYQALTHTVNLAPNAAAGKQAQQLLKSAIP